MEAEVMISAEHSAVLKPHDLFHHDWRYYYYPPCLCTCYRVQARDGRVSSHDIAYRSPYEVDPQVMAEEEFSTLPQR